MLRWEGLQKSVARYAATAAMMLICSGSPGESGSKVRAEAERAERVGAHDRAIELYSTAFGDASISNAERRDILKRRARLNERINQIDRALGDWSGAISIEPVDPVLYASRGFLFLRLRRYDDALADFAKGTALDEKSATYAYGTGRVHSDRQHYAEAISSYTKAITLDGNHATAYLWRGKAYIAQHSYRDARLDFERVLALNHQLLPSQQGRFYLGLGFVRMKTNEFALALTDLDKGLGILPNNLNGLRARAFVLETLGDRKRALKDYDRILDLKADDSWALERRSQLQVR
ncbi:tetratricopeptide repeat protein [Bradyrhizobium sp. JYMT SZCCT0180]|uniref:tetratricopeptide repeat protein n=1 Tax=Bradyrhizobium sp. JYMT SZCCT0180 TaxID=2807666 RepID=UPI001BAD4D27|nr:tetratricopeptide repeat protein [Bradyrhizobium sp. JYMT SZCCT0180]MBR1213673.1 tetratricopeptide repeat protein [Bradyrhizobium sp. JYMT SZCCT0180]